MGDRFEVNDDLSFGRGQPTDEDLRALAADGFRSVLDLRVEGEGAQALPPGAAEGAVVRRSGMQYGHLPVPSDRLDDDILDRFRRTVSSLPAPIFVHCASGKRSGTFALASAAIDAGQSGRTMLDRAEDAGATYGSEEMRSAVQRYVDRHAVGSADRRRQAAAMAPTRDRGVTRHAAGVLPPTMRRVEVNTPDAINERIEREIRSNVGYFATYPEEIDRRLVELDREWDIERTLETNAATLALAGTLLGAFVDRRFLVLPAAVAAFLLQHALQGWCPPLPFLRRWGVRTAAEIGRERTALKALRGDFRDLDTDGSFDRRARRAFEAAHA